MEALSAFLLLAALGGIVNILRFYAPRSYGDGILLTGFLLAIQTDVLLNGTRFLPWLLLLVTALAANRFDWSGGAAAVAGAVAVLLLATGLSPLQLIGQACAHAGVAAAAVLYRRRSQLEQEAKARFEVQQYRQSKQLNIIREVSNVFQSTLEYDQLQHVILTVLTAGYGLGFNRALLFLVSEDGRELAGSRGIGAMTQEEGLRTWVRIVSGNLRMSDLLRLRSESAEHDKSVQEQLAGIRVPLAEAGFMLEALNRGKPVLYEAVDRSDPLMGKLADTFGLTPFAVIPLLTHQQFVGVVITDNNINLEPITYQDLDAVIPIADQAASALVNALAYSRNAAFAITDGLTGLYNQRCFQSSLEEQVGADSSCMSVSLLVLDIDHFKHYNDTNGHPAGNEALKRVAEIMRASVRKGDGVFRFGGEEFIVLLPDASLKEAREIAERIRSGVEHGTFYNGHLQPGGCLTVSIGIACAPQHKQGPAELLEAADHALYVAKRCGRNQVREYGEGGEADDAASD